MPDSWTEEWLEVRPNPLIMSDTRRSIDRLCDEVLDRISSDGAPQPVIRAAEEAVTMNMTGLAVLLAEEVLAELPEGANAELNGDGFPGWSRNATESLVALKIREAAAETDAALYMAADDRFRARPGDCVRVLVRVLERSAEKLKSDLIADEQTDGGFDAVFARQTGNMRLALAVAKEVAAERF